MTKEYLEFHRMPYVLLKICIAANLSFTYQGVEWVPNIQTYWGA